MAQKRESIVKNLTAWYATSLVLFVSCASVFLYQSLQRGLYLEDKSILNDRIQAIVTLLQRPDREVGTLKRRIESDWSQRHFEKVYVRVMDGSRKVLAETPNTPNWIRTAVFRPRYVYGSQKAGLVPVPFTSPAGVPALLMGASVPYHGGSWSVYIAMVLNSQNRVLIGYERRLLITLIVTLLGALLIGKFLAARALKPVDALAMGLSKIDLNHLSNRLEANLPRELEILGRTFNKMLGKIAESMTGLAQFSADIAHELRSPINNLKGEIEVALSHPRTVDEYQELLGSNLEECERMKSLINSLLFLARSEGPDSFLQTQTLDLVHELREVIDFFQASAADKGVSLKFLCPENLKLTADRVLFQTALGNLLSNAIRYTPKGGEIQVEVLATHESTVIEVKDTGIGIPREHLSRVFDRLYRVDQQRSSINKENFGLGLSIVQAILRLHRGTTSIQSEFHHGTLVQLHFPADHRDVK